MRRGRGRTPTKSDMISPVTAGAASASTAGTHRSQETGGGLPPAGWLLRAHGPFAQQALMALIATIFACLTGLGVWGGSPAKILSPRPNCPARVLESDKGLSS